MPQVQQIRGNYRPDIDGLRALAVLIVLFFHLGISFFPGGYVGVDVFFVISGFLITRLISDEMLNTGGFRFANFYIRRVRRLFPSLVFTLLITFFAAFVFYSAQFFDRFSLSLLSSLFSVSNFYFWQSADYFAPNSEYEPLLHTWSLSVEEQFYLLWPLTLVFLIKKYPKHGPVILLTVIAIFSLSLNELFKDKRELMFYLLPFRVFEFAIGALLVWLSRRRLPDNRLLEILVIAGFSLIAYSVLNFTKQTIFPYFNAVIPCMGAACLIYAGQAKYSGKILSNRFVVGIGLISYSLYLIHWPIIVFYKYYKDVAMLNSFEISVIGIVSIVVAFLMYRFIEKPFRHGSNAGFKNRKFLVGSFAIFAALAISAFCVHAGHGFTWRANYSASEFKNTAYGGEKFPWETYIGNPAATRTLIVYGDSHSKQYLSALERFAVNNNIGIHYLGHPACLSLPNLTNVYQGSIHQSCLDMLTKLVKLTQGNDIPVLIAYRYTKTIADWQGRNFINFKDEQPYIKRLFTGLDKLHELLGLNRKILLMGSVPSANLKHGYLDCISRPISNVDCHDKYPIQEGEFYKLRSELKHYQQQRENVVFLDPYLALCDSINCYVTRNHQLYYSDHAHLTTDGANQVINMFSNQIVSVTGKLN